MNKILTILFLVVLAGFVAACRGKDKHQHHEVAGNQSGTTYTCPMHPQIVESEPGDCPICGMNLVPVKKAATEEGTSYTCPMHPQIVESEPGDCPICGMNLVPVKKAPGPKDVPGVMLSETQMQLGNISVRPVQTGQVGDKTVLTGRLVIDETQVDQISSRAAGRIEKLFVKETGKPIRKGQPLYQLYSESLLTLEQEYLLALNQVKAFPQEREFASILQAAKKKLLLMGLSQAQVNNIARSRRPDARITFLAPAGGVVTEIAAAEGVYVSEGSLLYRVNKLNNIWVEAELYAGEVNQVKVGSPLLVSVPGIPQAIKTKVAFINPVFRQNSQVVVARAALPNPRGRLIPGSQATIQLPATAKEGITLPLEAVIRGARGAHVWVQSGKNTFSPRRVTVGAESADQIEILSGLNPADTVVVTGAYLIYSESVLKNGGDPMAGHNH